MREHIIRGDQGTDWNLHLHRPLNDWEVDKMVDLVRHLDIAQLGALEEEDNGVWEADPLGFFTVKFCCHLLLPNVLGHPNSNS